jgi:tetratricopeptide (TPR) repeat protein
VVGLQGHSPGQWATLSKGLPRRIALFRDAHGAAKSVGVVVSPSVAVLDTSGRLRSSYVLYEPKLIEQLRGNLRDLAQGKGLVPDRQERRQRFYEDVARNAIGLEAAGMLKEALPLRRQLLRLELHPAADNASLGRLYFRLGEMDEAIACLRRSLELDTNLPVRAWLGRALARKGQLDEAKGYLTAALKLNPDKAVIHRTLADIAKKRGDVDGALQHMKAAIAHLRKKPGGDKK